ncbi:hypothetical protein SAMN05421882_105018 [Nitrosomonas communis]|uniref:Uncharacterized protein n=1 Tax=Nitrosomonas communis TaxID=44574 RepID=A0A1H2YF27_9PROT|nr:hypothetical protein SAMN05421882_105018 [Nitrosomonas communis]
MEDLFLTCTHPIRKNIQGQEKLRGAMLSVTR